MKRIYTFSIKQHDSDALALLNKLEETAEATGIPFSVLIVRILKRWNAKVKTNIITELTNDI